MFDFLDFSFFDILDILIVSVSLLYVYEYVRQRNIVRIFLGIGFLLGFWYVAVSMNMEMTGSVMSKFFEIGYIFFVIVFQKEIRDGLLKIGSTRLFRRSILNSSNTKYKITEKQLMNIARAAFSFTRTGEGALIVLERTVNLDIFCSSGEIIDSLITEEMVKNIFFKNAPMHDGAIIIRDGRIKAAKVVLPYTREDINAQFGMRHRAAIGITEKTDAISIVVSEETRQLKYVSEGQVISCKDKDELLRLLYVDFQIQL